MYVSGVDSVKIKLLGMLEAKDNKQDITGWARKVAAWTMFSDLRYVCMPKWTQMTWHMMIFFKHGSILL